MAEHPGDASGRVSPAGEPKQKNLVAVAIVINEEGVGAADVFRQPDAGPSSDPVVDDVPRPDAGVIIHDLRNSVGA